MPMVEVIVTVYWGVKECRNLELWMDSLKIDLYKTLAMMAGWLVFRLEGLPAVANCLSALRSSSSR